MLSAQEQQDSNRRRHYDPVMTANWRFKGSNPTYIYCIRE